MKKGWQTKKLHQVCKLLNGRAYNKSELLDDGRYPVLRVGNFFTNNHWYYSDLELEESKYCDTGDLLYAWSASFGPRIWTGGKAIFHYHIWKVVHDHAQVDKRYLFYFFQWDTEQAKAEQGAGTTMLHVSMGSMNERDIQIPPLPEQQRIVALLDEAFAGLATAKANAERNLQNACAVFESQLESVFANQWQTHELVRLADLATDITDGDHQPPPKSPIGVPFITIRNILKGSREIDFSDTFTVPRDYFDALKAHKKPRQGDVLYTVTGSFGIPVIVRDDAEFCFQRHIALVRPRPEISSSWLYYLLMSPQLFKKACDGATGTAQKTVSLTLLRSFVVPKASSQQQRQSAEKLDALIAETQHLTHLYERKLAALEELKQSLLQQAFNGEL